MKFIKNCLLIFVACFLIYSCNFDSENAVVKSPILKSISVTTSPQKTTYFEGEKFSAEGMVVTATYSDNTTKVVTDYTYSPAANLTTADKIITVTYTEESVTVTATVEIVVKQIPVLKSITVTTSPQKTTYLEGEKFSAEGMVVTATYSDNTTKVVTDYTYSPAGNLTTADKTVTVSYTEESVTVTATVEIVVKKVSKYNITFDYSARKNNYSTLKISGGTYTEVDGVITLTATAEETKYSLSGYFCGQIINNTKNTVLNLNGAYLENTEGKPVIVSTKKLEISAKENTENYIISTGTASGKLGTIYCSDNDGKSKNLEIGGKGTCYILGLYHGIKADEVKAKGNGTYYITGSSKGSAINCNTFLIEEDKDVTLILGNAKNAIKADETISVSSGTLWFENVTTAMKTDTLEDDNTKEYFIKVANCKIYTKGVDILQETEDGAYTQTNVILTNVE